MDRITLIQKIIKEANFSAYLEIGTQAGKSFLPIKCKYKIAVDPMFCISSKRKIKWLLKNPLNIKNKYFEETSDDFFAKKKSFLDKRGKIDIILIDGSHTFEGSLKDVLNSLKYLNDRGVIILHDCYPPNVASATPAKSKNEAAKKEVEGWTGEWCGDVWKTIVYLRRAFSDLLDVCIINTDYGLGIVRIKNKIQKPLSIDNKLFDEMHKIPFEEVKQNAESMIGLKDENFTKVLINELAAKI
ncbi:class I SAM-dependent methyltransferase [Patescibacteria group bacterium]|nr:class I SAM-dependent methyltransferase [Patescibacteria group bacterium]